MSFFKLLIGLLFLGFGGLFMAAAVGALPTGVFPWVMRFWPVILLAFALILIGKGLKNVAISVFALALVAGAFVAGGYWLSKQAATQEPPTPTTVIDLGTSEASSVLLRGRTIGGSYTVAVSPGQRGKIGVSGRDLIGRETTALGWKVENGRGYLTWPSKPGTGDMASFGSSFDVRLPERAPLRWDTSNYFAFGTADFTRGVLLACSTRVVSSSVKLRVGEGRPHLIYVKGTLSNVDIELPADCPARVEYTSRLTWHSIPEDFLEHVSGRVKGKAAFWTVEGKGPRVHIRVEGPLMRLRVTRGTPKEAALVR
ncbi:MAG TPA: hypothetical protein VFV24_06760 [Candidatus Eisenbacteria bacterium]|nr:hypothetical protein [Candidatus Eisenbacteria bacterium]